MSRSTVDVSELASVSVGLLRSGHGVVFDRVLAVPVLGGVSRLAGAHLMPGRFVEFTVESLTHVGEVDGVPAYDLVASTPGLRVRTRVGYDAAVLSSSFPGWTRRAELERLARELADA